MGANQLDGGRDQGVFFNFFFLVLYVSMIIGSTVLVYIQDNISWGLGFGLGAIANALGLVVLMIGVKYYRRTRPEGSPFVDLARVVVASMKKRKMKLTLKMSDYHFGVLGDDEKSSLILSTTSLRYFNRAALKVEGDVNNDGNIMRPWSLCTVQQVEDFKTIIKILPLWSTSIFLAISIGIQLGLTVLQALTLDRTISSHFSIPAGSLNVVSSVVVAVTLPLLDRVIYPMFDALFSHMPTPFQRIGLGHILNSLAMVASALIERRRLMIVRNFGLVESSQSTVPMSAVWLMWPLVLTGAGEALHFPGQVSFYYQEFPKSLSGMATGMIALLISLGFYLSTAVIDLVRSCSDWLPDNINSGRMDRVYWMLAAIATLNFGFFVWMASLYKYRNAT